MIETISSRHFKKQFKKLRASEQVGFEERVSIFVSNPFNPILNNHSLHGKYAGARSFNVKGDLRCVFKMMSTEIAYLIDIDTHPKLYS